MNISHTLTLLSSTSIVQMQYCSSPNDLSNQIHQQVFNRECNNSVVSIQMINPSLNTSSSTTTDRTNDALTLWNGFESHACLLLCLLACQAVRSSHGSTIYSQSIPADDILKSKNACRLTSMEYVYQRSLRRFLKMVWLV